MHALVVINPVAGRGRTGTLPWCEALARRVLGRHGYDVEIRTTTAAGDARRYGEEALARGTSLVVGWGGDGTVNELGSALALSGTPLGIVPGGSGNGLARDLGLPHDASAALDVAGRGRVRTIDAGELDGSLFFNVAGIGLDAAIARRMAQAASRRGLPGYVLATLAEWPRYVADRYRITGDGIAVDGPALFVALANSRQYGNGAQIAPAARLDDGKIDIVVVEAQPIWRVALRIPAFFRGTLTEGRGLIMRQASSVVIESAARLAFHVDGEPRQGGTTLTLETRPAALRVRVP